MDQDPKAVLKWASPGLDRSLKPWLSQRNWIQVVKNGQWQWSKSCHAQKVQMYALRLMKVMMFVRGTKDPMYPASLQLYG